MGVSQSRGINPGTKIMPLLDQGKRGLRLYCTVYYIPQLTHIMLDESSFALFSRAGKCIFCQLTYLKGANVGCNYREIFRVRTCSILEESIRLHQLSTPAFFLYTCPTFTKSPVIPLLFEAGTAKKRHFDLRLYCSAGRRRIYSVCLSSSSIFERFDPCKKIVIWPNSSSKLQRQVLNAKIVASFCVCVIVCERRRRKDFNLRASCRNDGEKIPQQQEMATF